MSFKLIVAIWDRPRDELDPSEKFLLTVMAERADPDGLLWYAVDTIAEKTSFTPRAVRKIMDRLIAKGLVKKHYRRDRSNFYVIQRDRFPLRDTKGRKKETGPAEYLTRLEIARDVDDEPELFGTTERGSPRLNDVPFTDEPRSSTTERRSADSLNDSLNDPPREAAADYFTLIVYRWNDIAAQHEALSPVRFLSDVRKRQIELRTDEWAGKVALPTDHNSPKNPVSALWAHVFNEIERSKLLTGQKLDWAPTLDWVLGPKNFAKIMEGNYGHGHDRIGAPSKNAADRSAVAAGQAARELVERSRNRSAHEHSGGHSGRVAGADC